MTSRRNQNKNSAKMRVLPRKADGDTSYTLVWIVIATLLCIMSDNTSSAFSKTSSLIHRKRAPAVAPQTSSLEQKQKHPLWQKDDIDIMSKRQPATSLSASIFEIDQMPPIVQVGTFLGIYISLGASTLVGVNFLDILSKDMIGLETWRNLVIEKVLPIVLGGFYFFAGMGHFLFADAFTGIYPPRGTWGFWYVPGSADFHVAWTGVVELLSGLALVISGLGSFVIQEDDGTGLDAVFKLFQPMAAASLFGLTVLVTPANIYMFTHGAEFGSSGSLGLSFHLIRFGVQIILLSVLLTLTKDSLLFAWGDELD